MLSAERLARVMEKVWERVDIAGPRSFTLVCLYKDPEGREDALFSIPRRFVDTMYIEGDFLRYEGVACNISTGVRGVTDILVAVMYDEDVNFDYYGCFISSSEDSEPEHRNPGNYISVTAAMKRSQERVKNVYTRKI